MTELESELELEWPTNRLKDIIDSSNYEHEEKPISIRLAPDVKDVTFETGVKDQLRRYVPDIKLIGIGLRRERYTDEKSGWAKLLMRKNLWGGLLVRCLETKSAETQDDKTLKRCLQYIFIWTKQQSAVSALWMIVVPLLMSVWAFIIRNLYAVSTTSDLLLPILATGFVSLPLLFSAIWDHRWDLQTGGRFTFRSTTLLLPFSIMMWFVAFSWIVHTMIFAFTVFVCFFYWILDQIGFVGTSHDMDYLPVFVWLKLNEANAWEFDRAFWDRHHYSIEYKKAKELRKRRYRIVPSNLPEPNADKPEERIRLQMDNPWHSVRPGGSVRFLFLILSVIGLIIFVPIALLQYTSGQYTEFYNGGLVFVIACTLIVLAFRTILRTASPLLKDDDLEGLDKLRSNTDKNYLHKKRLDMLWNLVKTRDTGHPILMKLRERRRGGKEFQPDIRPRLVVITKLQDPFNHYGLSEYEKSFRDDPEYLYLYISTRCRILDDDELDADEDLSLETKIVFQKKGIKMYPAARARFAAVQRLLADKTDPISLAQDLIQELDDKERKVTSKQIEEFKDKRQ